MTRQAIEQYKKVLEVDPSDENAHYKLALQLFEEGRLTETYQVANKIVSRKKGKERMRQLTLYEQI